MRWHAIFEDHQVILDVLRIHSTLFHLFQDHLVIVDSLTAGGDFQPLVKQVKA